MATSRDYVRHAIMTLSSCSRDNPLWLTSAEAFSAHVRAKLSPVGASAPAPGPSDYDLNGGPPAPGSPPIPAAVLIPIVARSELSVLLTKRTATLARHAGQIAFPGGRIDDGDASPVAAALREAHEEIGLDPARVSVLGTLDTYRSGTGYAITPVVALTTPGQSLTLHPGEVDEVFEVPLAFLMAAATMKIHSRIWQGSERHYYAIPFGERYIWGVTAGIIRNMQLRLV